MPTALANKKFNFVHKSRIVETLCCILFSGLWVTENLNTTQTSFVLVINKSSFFLFNLCFFTMFKKQNRYVGVQGICFKKEIWVKWNQGNLFLEDLFWISIMAKECEHKNNHMFLKFSCRLDGVKPIIQSVGIRECCMFMSKFFLIRKVGCN